MKFSHTRLLVDDFKACLAFYRDVMGFKTLWNDDENYAEFDTGTVLIAINSYQLFSDALGLPAQRPVTDRAMLIFAVDDVDAAARALTERGAPMLVPPQDRPTWGIRTAHFRDPAGNLIEINQPLTT